MAASASASDVGAVGVTTLKRKKDFEALFATGLKLSRAGLCFYLGPGEAATFRWAAAIPRRFGKATERNLVRRRLREVLRTRVTPPAAVDMLISLYRPCRQFDFAALGAGVAWACEQAPRQLARWQARRRAKTVADAPGAAAP